MNCDYEASTPNYAFDANSVQTPCSPRVILTTKEACPVMSLFTLWYFLNSYSFVTGLIMIFAGIWFMIEGGRKYKLTMFLAGQFSLAIFLMLVLFTQVFPEETPFWVVWFCLIVSLCVGTGVGFAAQRWSRIGVLIIGGWIGGLLGALSYGVFFHIFAQ